jgi:glycosyltransferase involved in cell wall biosynthesis
VHDLARALAARGQVVHVVTSAPVGICPVEAGVVEHRLPIRAIPGTDVAVPDPLGLSLVRRLFERERISLVHAHGLFSTLAIGGIVAGRALGLPTVLTCHSLVGGLWRRGAARLLLSGFVRGVDELTAVGSAAAGDVSALSGREVPVLPNGIDPCYWNVHRGDSPDAVHLLSVMRLERVKQGDALLHAFAHILGRIRSVPVVLTIAGDGPERARLEQLSARLGLTGRVRWFGRATRSEVARLLGTATVFMSACRSEAFGLAALEARCAGVPVVALRGGGIDEIVEDGRTGVLADSTPGLAGAVVRLIEDPELRARMARRALEGVERYGWDAVVARHLDVYERAIGRRVRTLRARAA